MAAICLGDMRGILLISSLTAADHLINIPLNYSVEILSHLVLVVRWRRTAVYVEMMQNGCCI